MDWNWFFTAFAQCAAALIGIIAAFIISKLLGENDRLDSQNNKLKDLKIVHKDLINRISVRRFEWYDHINIKHSNELSEAIKKGDFSDASDLDKLEVLFKIEPSLFRTEKCIDYLNEKIEKHELKSRGSAMFKQLQYQNFFDSIPPVGIWDNLRSEYDKISSLFIETKAMIKKFEKCKEDISNSKKYLSPIKITIWILSIGMIITVVYPLHFIPMIIGEEPHIVFSLKLFLIHLISLKGLLLFTLTLVIESVLGYFLFLANKIVSDYEKMLISIDDSFLNLTSYSKYFNNNNFKE